MRKFIICLFATAGMFMQVYGQTDFVKDPNNPVLLRGTNGDWDDALVGGPYTMSDGSTYHMWYAGYDGSTGTNIGYATSQDGVIWTKYDDSTTTSPPYTNSDPVLTTGPSGSWDEVADYQPCVLFDGTTYHMWFGGHEGTTRQIAYATSTDSINWTKYDDPTTTTPPYAESDPVLKPGDPGDWDDVWVDSPEVLFINGVYHMWYSGNDGSITQTGHATSSDGITWNKDTQHNPVLRIEPGGWDDIMCYQPSVLFDGSTYHMWYSGGGAFLWSIGYAYSSDGINWTKYDDTSTTNPPYAESDPVLISGLSGSWDDTYVGLCGVIFNANGDSVKMWYSGGTGFGMAEIGYATAPFDTTLLSIGLLDRNVPNDYVLHQNYPNPFNPSTNIDFSIPKFGFVTLKVYNVLGEEVATLVSERLAAGNYNYDWDASGLASGVYLYRIQTENVVQVRKMVLMK